MSTQRPAADDQPATWTAPPGWSAPAPLGTPPPAARKLLDENLPVRPAGGHRKRLRRTSEFGLGFDYEATDVCYIEDRHGPELIHPWTRAERAVALARARRGTSTIYATTPTGGHEPAGPALLVVDALDVLAFAWGLA